MPTNRIVALLAGLLALCGGLAPVVADLDFTSTSGILVGVAAAVSVVNKWLDGWQQHESRESFKAETARLGALEPIE